MSFWTLKKRSISLITEFYSQSFLFEKFELIVFYSVHTLKIEYTVSLSLALLKELLNMVYHKGQSWDLYSSASMLMIYLYICHQTLQNVICSQQKASCALKKKKKEKQKKKKSFVLTVFQCSATLITCSSIL